LRVVTNDVTLERRARQGEFFDKQIT
jgi:hypothetical protein